MGTAPTPAPAASGGLEQNICGLLCWLPIGPVPLVADIVFLLAEPYKNNKFIRFHAFQSLFFMGAGVCLGIGLMILGVILAFMGPLALLMLPIDLVVGLGMLVATIFMCVKAFSNETTKLPIIGPLAAKYAGL